MYGGRSWSVRRVKISRRPQKTIKNVPGRSQKMQPPHPPFQIIGFSAGKRVAGNPKVNFQSAVSAYPVRVLYLVCCSVDCAECLLFFIYWIVSSSCFFLRNRNRTRTERKPGISIWIAKSHYRQTCDFRTAINYYHYACRPIMWCMMSLNIDYWYLLIFINSLPFRWERHDNRFCFVCF